MSPAQGNDALLRSRAALCIQLCGERLVALASGGLWWPEARVLVVADLHLEKGSSFGARGQMLPPYDTDETLSRLEGLLAGLCPDSVVLLGDSFHDRGAVSRMSERSAERLKTCTRQADWIWIEGNHDPHPPNDFGGVVAAELSMGPLTFRHMPCAAPADGEIAGHLHPAARVVGRGRSVRARCFALLGDRLVLPAFGAFTGGLNLLNPAFGALSSAPPVALVLGEGGGSIHRVEKHNLAPDPAGIRPTAVG